MIRKLTTAKDPTGDTTRLAIAQLVEAQRTRKNYDDLLQASITVHGDVQGTPTSGCYNPAWPEHIKDDLRTMAGNIGKQVEMAYTFWRRAGRRVTTLRPIAEQYRYLKDGRVSYY